MIDYNISVYLAEKRFRRRLKSIAKRKKRRKKGILEFDKNRLYLLAAKKIKSYEDALVVFLPRNLSYLVYDTKSPFYIKKLEKEKSKKVRNFEVPECFSIIENETESYLLLRQIISAFIYQTCDEIWLDYKKCKKVDLVTQVFFDAILLEIDNFIKKCKKGNIYNKYVRLASVGGKNIDDKSVNRLLNSVGSPTELIKRRILYKDIIPYRLRCFDGEGLGHESMLAQKEIDTTTLLDYVNSCLKRVKKKLSREAMRDLGCVIGETLINAEEHSSLKYRYLIGYFEECMDGKRHFGMLNLVILNFGQTIYEKFKYPNEDSSINFDCLAKMKELSDSFKSRNIFKKDAFTEETLWTLYSLQEGVSCIPKEICKRGNGTIQFIDSFFKLKGNDKADNISRMYLLSGNTRIEFDGTYKLVDIKDENGTSRGIISFNKSGKLTDVPDKKYVYTVPNYFPGTAIFAKLLINDDDLNNEQN